MSFSGSSITAMSAFPRASACRLSFTSISGSCSMTVRRPQPLPNAPEIAYRNSACSSRLLLSSVHKIRAHGVGGKLMLNDRLSGDSIAVTW